MLGCTERLQDRKIITRRIKNLTKKFLGDTHLFFFFVLFWVFLSLFFFVFPFSPSSFVLFRSIIFLLKIVLNLTKYNKILTNVKSGACQSRASRCGKARDQFEITRRI